MKLKYDNGFAYYYDQDSGYGSDLTNIFGNGMQLCGANGSTLNFDNCIFECFISTAGNTYTDGADEPAFELKVEVIFNATGKKPDTFINGKSSSCIERSNSITLKSENGYNSAENSITISSLPANYQR